MREEQVTKAILKWLIDGDWEIICFDFPQSGTGRFLHPNERGSHKNKASINPDIIAVKECVCVLFENKDRFYLPDYEKIHGLIVQHDYSDAIDRLLEGRTIQHYFYGIGLPCRKHTKASEEASHLVDFIVGVEEDYSARVLYMSAPNIF